jgi:hypothetical protein
MQTAKQKFLVLFVQDIAHMDGGYSPPIFNVLTYFLLAGFEVTTIGRICVTAEGSGSKYVFESECVHAGSTMHSKGTRTFNGYISVHTEKTTTFAPPMDGIAETTLIMDEKYVGACPAGMQPGESMDADGKIIHKRR